MTDEPTLGEAMRRLDAVTRQLEALAKTMAEDRRDFATIYVPRELYNSRHSGLERRVAAIEVENKAREDDEDGRRRQVTVMVIGAALTAVVSFLVSMATLIAGGFLGG